MHNHRSKSRVHRNCEYCGKEFEAIPAQVRLGMARFCSRECGSANRRRRVPRVCEVCDKAFWVHSAVVRDGQGRFCSRECDSKRRRNRVACTCEVCGKAFKVSLSNFKRKVARFCSTRCMGESRAIPAEERFWRRVEKSETCWFWMGEPGATGYGRIPNAPPDGKWMAAHRFSWVLHHGPIPAGLFCLHSCDVRLCVNPDHLFLGTKKDNTQDMLRKGRQGDTGRQGARHHNAKLTDQDVRAIRTRHAQGGIFYPELAREYGVSITLIYRVVRRKAWPHVE